MKIINYKAFLMENIYIFGYGAMAKAIASGLKGEIEFCVVGRDEEKLKNFAKEYNLEEIPIEKEGKEASLKYVFKIIKIAKQNNIKIVFTSPEFSKKSAQLIANKIGGKVISFSPLKYDILKNILNIAKIINEYNRD